MSMENGSDAPDLDCISLAGVLQCLMQADSEKFWRWMMQSLNAVKCRQVSLLAKCFCHLSEF
jgi:hypothetical protein